MTYSIGPTGGGEATGREVGGEVVAGVGRGCSTLSALVTCFDLFAVSSLIAKHM